MFIYFLDALRWRRLTFIHTVLMEDQEQASQSEAATLQP